MSRSEQELRQALGAARALDTGDAQCSQLEDVVRHADAGEFHQLAMEARRSLASAYSVQGYWDRAFPLFARCLSEFDTRPEVFGPGYGYRLRNWYCWIIQSMAEFPDIPLSEITSALDDVERRYRAAGDNLADVFDVRRTIAQWTRDWDTEERYHRLWHAAGTRPEYIWDYAADVQRLLDRGDAASIGRAHELAAPVLRGDRTFDEPPVPIQCAMLLPLVRAGKYTDAILGYRRSRRSMRGSHYRVEYAGMQIEFCALTGNLAEAIDLAASRACLARRMTRPSGRMSYYVASTLLARQLIDAGRGSEQIDLSCGHESEKLTAAAMYEKHSVIAVDLAARFDARNGNSGVGDHVRARIGADRLPRVPLTGAPKQSRIVPDAAWCTPLQNLEYAERYFRENQPRVARQFLDALGEPPTELAPRATQLGAQLVEGQNFAAEMESAAAAHRAIGDEVRALECVCLRSAWLRRNGGDAEALELIEATLPAVRETHDPYLIGTAELEYGMCLGWVSRHEEKAAALARARTAADRSGHPFLPFDIANAEFSRVVFRKLAIATRLAAARNSVAAATRSGAVRKVVAAVDNLYDTHAGSDTLDEFDAEIAALLAHDGPTEVRAGLGYGEAVRLIDTGRAAVALGRMEAVVAAARPSATARLWFLLATCYAAAGAPSASVEAADVVDLEWHDKSASQVRNKLGRECRGLLAEQYAVLGEWDKALPHLEKLIELAGDDPDQQAHVLAACGDALAQLDRPVGAVEKYRAAWEFSARTADTARTARCATAFLRSLMVAGRFEEAVAALPSAESAVRAFAPLPAAPGEWLAWARLHEVGAQLFASVGRGPEAVAQAGHAASEFRLRGEDRPALEMDAVAARILLGDKRPDLALPILDAALAAAPTALHADALIRLITDLRAYAMEQLSP